MSQSNSCTQVLRNVRTLYENGRLQELKNSVSECLDNISTENNSEFSKEEKREVYRYLALTNIFLNQPSEADEMMLKLLKSDHYYKPSLLLEPLEYIALYNKFRNRPLFRVGLKFGSNVSLPLVIKSYSVGNNSSGKGEYKMAPSFQSYLVFEKDFKKNFVLSLEAGFVKRIYNYSNNFLSTPIVSNFSSNLVNPSFTKFKETQNCIDFNVFLHYNLINTQKKAFFFGVGPGVTYLINSSNQPQTTLNGFKQSYVVTGAKIEDTRSFRSINYSASAIVGLKIRLGEIYITTDARYQFGLNNVLEPLRRTNEELAFDYQIIPNDYRINNFILNVGILYSYFKPKKLTK